MIWTGRDRLPAAPREIRVELLRQRLLSESADVRREALAAVEAAEASAEPRPAEVEAGDREN